LERELGEAPETAVVLGSGLDVLTEAAAVHHQAQVSFGELPGWPEAAVAGHPGLVSAAFVEGRRVALLRGRAHLYEGHPRSVLQQPLLALARWGVTNLVLTYAVGALTDKLRVPGLAVVSDVIDLQFPPPSSGRLQVLTVASSRTRELASAAGLPQVVYAAVMGPQYETQAEVGVLQSLGAEVVGMSAVPEVQAACRLGLGLLVLVLVTNKAGESGVSVGRAAERIRDDLHQEVLQRGVQGAQELRRCLRQWWHILQHHEE